VCITPRFRQGAALAAAVSVLCNACAIDRDLARPPSDCIEQHDTRCTIKSSGVSTAAAVSHAGSGVTEGGQRGAVAPGRSR